MTEIILGLFFGMTLGLCVSPLWMMLSLPMRLTDILDAGSMKMCALALTMGAATGAMEGITLPLGQGMGILSMFCGGIFLGMLASGLTEALEVIPALCHRLRITDNMQLAAAALMLGKMAGALFACLNG